MYSFRETCRGLIATTCKSFYFKTSVFFKATARYAVFFKKKHNFEGKEEFISNTWMSMKQYTLNTKISKYDSSSAMLGPKWINVHLMTEPFRTFCRPLKKHIAISTVT